MTDKHDAPFDPTILDQPPRDDGGPAFPSVDPVHTLERGMTLRDYFAGQVLEGMHARDTYDPAQKTPQQRAALAYLDADAMIAERAKAL